MSKNRHRSRRWNHPVMEAQHHHQSPQVAKDFTREDIFSFTDEAGVSKSFLGIVPFKVVEGVPVPDINNIRNYICSGETDTDKVKTDLLAFLSKKMSDMTQTETVHGIEYPPDSIFKHSKNREKPEEEVWNNSVMYIPTRAEYIDGVGNFVYYEGCPFPSKTVAPAQAIYAITVVKRFLVNILRFATLKEARIPMCMFLFVGKRRRVALLEKACSYLNDMADTVVTPYYLGDGYYCPVVKQIRVFIDSFLTSLGVSYEIAHKTSEIIGMFFEYDNAYRMRVQDVLDAANKEALVDPLLYDDEIQRLLILEKERDITADVPWNGQDVPEKFRKVFTIVKYLRYIPSLRRALRNGFEAMDFDACKLDEGDIYHTLLYKDYNTRGKTVQERFEMYADIHGKDPTKWPPRIIRISSHPSEKHMQNLKQLQTQEDIPVEFRTPAETKA